MSGALKTSSLVGRIRELASLERALAALPAGAGGVVLVEGDAGIGKTRLIRELCAKAEDRGYRLLQGACLESDQALPYAPLLELLVSMLREPTTEQQIADVKESAPYLVRTLPELQDWLPEAAAAEALEPEAEKRRFVHAVGRLFAAVAKRAPLLVVVEDLHWADDATLELLSPLARTSASEHFLLLLSCRPEERRPAVGRLLGGVQRERLMVEQLQLGPLGLADVDMLTRQMLELGRPTPADLLHMVYRVTEGNPFFVEEILRALPSGSVASDGALGRIDQLPIPRTVEEAVQQRTEQLGAESRRLLELAAAIGQRFEFGLLQELAGCSEEDLLRYLKDLVRTQLLEEPRVDEFAFHHALTREAIYHRLLGRERRTLHQRIGVALERRAGGTPEVQAAELAYHFHAAGDWNRTQKYAALAGKRALAVQAPHAAIEQLDRALSAAGFMGTTSDANLLQLRGSAYEVLGDFATARQDYEAALASARQACDRRQEWQALVSLGMLWTWRDYAVTGDYFLQALELARKLGDPLLVAQSLNRVGNWHLNLDHPLEALAHHREALTSLEQIGDQRGVAETLSLLAMSNYLAGDLRHGTEYCRRTIDAFHALGDRQAEAENMASLALGALTLATDTCVPVLSPSEACALVQPAIGLARASGWRSGEAFAQFNLAYCYGSLGQYADALACAQACVDIAQEIEHGEWTAAGLCALGALHRELLRFVSAQDYLQRGLERARAIGAPHWIGHAAGMLASVFVDVGELESAERVLDSALTDKDPIIGYGQSRFLWCVRAELAVAEGRPEDALDILLKLDPSEPEELDQPPRFRIARTGAAALAAIGRTDDAVLLLRQVEHWAIRWSALSWVWRTQVALGRLRLAQRQRLAANELFASARQVIQQVAANVPEANDLRSTFLYQAQAQLPRTRPPSVKQVSKAAFGGLTEREREVAALVAQARSNSEIALTLVIGERTVETHVANILAKLGLRSRRDIAPWAAAHGL